MGNVLPILRLRPRLSSLSEPRKRNDDGSIVAFSRRDAYYTFGTLCLNSHVDVEKALKRTSMPPKTLRVGGKFLNTMNDELFPTLHHKKSLQRILHRGYKEVKLQGSNPQAPRRVFDTEISFVLAQLPPAVLEGLVMENLNVQPSPPTLNLLNSNNSRLSVQLAKLTNLQSIVLTSTRVNRETLQHLLKVFEKLPRLQHVTLQLMDLSEDDIVQVEEATTKLLATSQVLKSLALSIYPSSPAMWHAVEASQSLHSLSVACDTTTAAATNNLSEIQQLLLLSPKSLKSLELRKIPSGTKFDLLADGLRNNTSLKTLHLTLNDHHFADTLLNALISVLEFDNFTLTELTLHREMPAGEMNICIPSATVEFYTQINNRQRQHLLREEPTREEWRQTLIQAATASTTDLSTLYYWLRVQPTLLPLVEH